MDFGIHSLGNGIVNKLGKLDEADGDPFAEPPISDSDFAESLIDSKVNYPINAVFERYPIDCSSTSKCSPTRELLELWVSRVLFRSYWPLSSASNPFALSAGLRG